MTSALTIVSCCGLFGAACFGLGQKASPSAQASPQTPGPVLASEFVLVDEQGRTCARLGLAGEEPELHLFEPRSGRCQVELGVDFMGGTFLRLRDMCSDTGPDAEVLLENQGDPGVPTIRLLGKPMHSGERAELRLEVNSLEPSLIATSRAGRVTQYLERK